MTKSKKTEEVKEETPVAVETPKPAPKKDSGKMFPLCTARKRIKAAIPNMVLHGRPAYVIPENHPDEVPWALVEKYKVELQMFYGRTLEELADRTKEGLTVEGLAHAVNGRLGTLKPKKVMHEMSHDAIATVLATMHSA